MATLANQLEGIALAQQAKETKDVKKSQVSIRNRLLAIFETRQLNQVIFDTAACLATPKDAVTFQHYSTPQTRDLAEKIKDTYGSYCRKYPTRFGIHIDSMADVKADSADNGSMHSRELRKSIIHASSTSVPETKFIIIGMEEGLSTQLLGDSHDISFRQCLNACPVIVKPRTNMIPFKIVDNKNADGSPKNKRQSQKQVNYLMLELMTDNNNHNNNNNNGSRRNSGQGNSRRSSMQKEIENIEEKSLQNTGRKPVNWAFVIDYSDESMYAFEQMLDHISIYDTIHLLYCKPPPTKSDFFQSDSADTVQFIFQPFISLLKRTNFASNFDKQNINNNNNNNNNTNIKAATAINTARTQFDIKTNVVKTILNDPNVGAAITGYVNHKKRNIHFLTMYTDMMTQASSNADVIGSASDYCVRHAKCAVVLPRMRFN